MNNLVNLIIMYQPLSDQKLQLVIPIVILGKDKTGKTELFNKILQAEG